MSNQLTELFDMTDTSDVPDEVIEALLKLLRCSRTIDSVRSDARAEVKSDRLILAFARLIAREHPEWIEDPDLVAAREVLRNHGYQHKWSREENLAVAAFKAGRAAERANQ